MSVCEVGLLEVGREVQHRGNCMTKSVGAVGATECVLSVAREPGWLYLISEI